MFSGCAYFMMFLLYGWIVEIYHKGAISAKFPWMVLSSEHAFENWFKSNPVIFPKHKTQCFGGTHLKVDVLFIFHSCRY